MAKVFDFDWKAEITLTRREVVSLGVLAEFVGNLEADYKAMFPAGTADVDWRAVRGAFHEFRRAYDKDKEMQRQLTEILKSFNGNEAPNPQAPAPRP